MTNLMASPPAPQPWQKYAPRAGDTVNEAVFSSWNGHRPLRLPPPADLRVTCSEITSTTETRSRTSAMSSSRIRPATGPTPFRYILPDGRVEPEPGTARDSVDPAQQPRGRADMPKGRDVQPGGSAMAGKLPESRYGGILRDRSVQQKIAVTTWVALLVAITVGVFGLWQMSSIAHSGRAIYSDALVPNETVLKLRETVTMARYHAVSRAAAGTPAAKQQYSDALTADEQQIDALTTAYGRSRITAQQQATLKQFVQHWQA